MAQITEKEKEQALNHIKNNFIKMYRKNAEQMFNTLGEDKINQLFKINSIDRIIDPIQLRNLFNTNQDFLNNALQFIKIE